GSSESMATHSCAAKIDMADRFDCGGSCGLRRAAAMPSERTGRLRGLRGRLAHGRRSKPRGLREPAEANLRVTRRDRGGALARRWRSDRARLRTKAEAMNRAPRRG